MRIGEIVVDGTPERKWRLAQLHARGRAIGAGNDQF